MHIPCAPTTASELAAARHRIALLEQELASLRSATPTPTLPSQPPTPVPTTPPPAMLPLPVVSPAASEVSRHVSEDRSRRRPQKPRRRPTKGKKERAVIAKCTEPRAGQTRYWTVDEHDRFLEAIAQYGEKAYVDISNYVETRTPKQVRTHAQKFQMKMGRLAKQSIEAGEPVRMPKGMAPVVQVETAEGKVALVPLVGGGAPVGVSVVVVPPNGNEKDPLPKADMEVSTSDDQVHVTTQEEDELVKVASVVSEESSSALTDPYMDYIGGNASGNDVKVEMELDASFADNISGGLVGNATGVQGNCEGVGGGDDSGDGSDDDDLEDLRNLEDQEFAAFTTNGEGWLLPESS